jgi:hypothetical protein
MNLVELVLAVHRHLHDGLISHAFGGALALAYVADPRGTADIDLNVFAPPAEIDPALSVLARLDLHPEHDRDQWLASAGIRLRSAALPFPVDVFPSLDARYAEVERRVVWHPFGPEETLLPFLSAEDLTMFKLSFGRDRDWVDLRAIAAARPDLDIDYIEAQLVGLRGPSMYPRLARLRALVRGPR